MLVNTDVMQPLANLQSNTLSAEMLAGLFVLGLIVAIGSLALRKSIPVACGAALFYAVVIHASGGLDTPMQTPILVLVILEAIVGGVAVLYPERPVKSAYAKKRRVGPQFSN